MAIEIEQFKDRTLKGVMSNKGQLVMFFSDGFQLIVSGIFEIYMYHLQQVEKIDGTMEAR